MIRGSQLWGKPEINLFDKVIKLQEKAIRIINIKDDHSPTNHLLGDTKI